MKGLTWFICLFIAVFLQQELHLGGIPSGIVFAIAAFVAKTLNAAKQNKRST